MKIAVASMLQEGNTFSPVMTRYEDFSPVYGEAASNRHRGKLTEFGGFLDVLDKERVESVPVCAAWAITANRCLPKDFEKLVGNFRKRLKPADGLLLAMHGSQTAEGVDDVEGHVLGVAREVLGPDIPIVLTLDLHGNITRAMVERATAIVGYHTYPHIDMFETGQKAARLMLRILRGHSNPTMAFRKLPLLLVAENAQTYSGPMGRLIKRAKSMKAEAVSVFQVQPWMDIAEMGCAAVSVTNGDMRAAQRQVDELALKMWRTKAEFDPDLVSVPEAIARALKVEGGPVVFAESSDSTGSGSPGDSTGVLKHLPREVSSAIFLVDPWAVAQAVKAGVGNRVKMSIGGCYDKINSKPVRVNGYVRLISDGRWTARARGYNTGIETCMGRTVVLEVGQIKVLIAEKSAMTVDPELFRSHGIEPLYQKIVVVKSPLGFRAAYEPLAKAMYVVDTPGVSTARLERMPWKRISRPIYPLDRDVTFP